MNGFTAALLVWTLISPSGGGHGGTGDVWPTHMACRNEGLEVFYQSCGKFFQMSACVYGEPKPTGVGCLSA